MGFGSLIFKPHFFFLLFNFKRGKLTPLAELKEPGSRYEMHTNPHKVRVSVHHPRAGSGLQHRVHLTKNKPWAEGLGQRGLRDVEAPHSSTPTGVTGAAPQRQHLITTYYGDLRKPQDKS